MTLISDQVRRADALDREAVALGYPSSRELHGLRPSYLMRMRQLADRTGDADAHLVVDRLQELALALKVAHDEHNKLMDVLREWESVIGFMERVR